MGQRRHEWRPYALPAAQIAGLLATGWIVWLSSLLPQLDRRPLRVLLGDAIEYALLAWAWSAGIALCLYLVMPKSPRVNVLQMTLRTSTTAVWFAPAMTLLSAFSPTAIPAALVLVISATRLLYFHWHLIHADAESPGIAAGSGDALFLRQLAPDFAAAACIQGGAVALSMRYPLLAAALLALGVAMLTLLWNISGATEPARPQSLPRSILGVVLTLILAAGLTVTGWTGPVAGGSKNRWDLHSQPRPGVWTSARALLHALLYGEESHEPEEVVTRVAPRPGEASEVNDGSFPGVVLLPEVRPHTILVAPRPAFAGGAAVFAPVNSYSIPFSGEYWMFKPPYTRPPRNSFSQRGSPLALSFITTDRRPMLMEAHHRLDQPIPFRCCRKIQVVIFNTDRYPGTVSLELILIHRSERGVRAQTLGREPVTAFPERRRMESPAWQVLEFSLPAAASLDEFNEFEIAFHRDRVRAERSARISIERFVLVP